MKFGRKDLLSHGTHLWVYFDPDWYMGLQAKRKETQLSLTNRATRLEVSQGHQTRYHSIRYVWFPITML